jgi:hypothetical protein
VGTEQDILVTALYVRIDDCSRASSGRAPHRPGLQMVLRIGDADLVTLSVVEVLPGSPRSRRLRVAARI